MNIFIFILFIATYIILCIFCPTFYNYAGGRAIWEKIFPPTTKLYKNSPKPSTFILWAISIYIALFSIASARYDRAVNSFEMQISAFQTQMASDSRAEACANLENLQKTTIPIQPDILKFWNTFISFFQENKYQIGQKILLQTVEAYKKKLNGANLNFADLKYADLNSANLKNANLSGTNLTGAHMISADLSNVDVTSIYIQYADDVIKKIIFKKTDKNNLDIIMSILLMQNSCKADLTKLSDIPYLPSKLNYNKLYLEGVKLKSLGFINRIVTTYCITNDFSWVPLFKKLSKESILNKIDLDGINIIDSLFSIAFPPTNLTGADLRYAHLNGTILTGANLRNTNFENAKLIKTQFINTDLRNAKFMGADLAGANFSMSDLSNANLEGSKNITAKQLSTAILLYKTKLPSKIKKELRETHRQLFKRPDWYVEEKLNVQTSRFKFEVPENYFNDLADTFNQFIDKNNPKHKTIKNNTDE